MNDRALQAAKGARPQSPSPCFLISLIFHIIINGQVLSFACSDSIGGLTSVRMRIAERCKVKPFLKLRGQGGRAKHRI